MSDELYREQILDHYWNPRNHGTLPHPDASGEDVNPLCGDQIRLDIVFDHDRVNEVRFSGQGCAISQASTSMLTEKIQGMDKEHLRQLNEQDIFDMLGVPISPARTKCALLGWLILRKITQ